MTLIKDMTGIRFGRLVASAIDTNSEPSKDRSIRWKCVCDCGNSCTATGTLLRLGKIKSCGCLYKESRKDTRRTHGLKFHPSYSTWKGMMYRCYNPSSKAFRYYGGRGITVSDRWKLCENFIADVGVKPVGHSLERICNDKGYSAENCKWATPNEQSRNKSSTVVINVDGVAKCLTDWATDVGITAPALSSRLRKGIPQSIAVSAKAAPGRKTIKATL